jgi:hypothetical protein
VWMRQKLRRFGPEGMTDDERRRTKDECGMWKPELGICGKSK